MYLFIENHILKPAVLINFRILHDNAILHGRPLTNKHRAEDDGIFHRAFNNAAVSDQAVFHAGPVDILGWHLVLDFCVDRMPRMEELLLHLSVQQAHIQMEIGCHRMQPSYIAVMLIAINFQLFNVGDQHVRDEVIFSPGDSILHQIFQQILAD